jgi:hypothetical protein
MAVQRQMVPYVQYLLRYSLKTLLGIESMHTLSARLSSDEVLMRLVGFQAHHRVCQRGAVPRQGPHIRGPTCSDALPDNMVKLNRRVLAQTGVLATNITGIVDATDLETTAQHKGCGQVTRQRKMVDMHGKGHEIEVTVYGWKLIVVIDAHPKIPLAGKMVLILP